MKFNTTRKYLFTAEVYDFDTVNQGGPTDGTTYFLLKNIKLAVVQDEFGRVVCIFKDSESNLRPGMRLEELRDKGGKELWPGGVWTLDTYEPNVNSFGYREGFNARATLTHQVG